MGVSVAGLFDDNLEVKSLLDYPVYGAFDAERFGDDALIVSVGVNNIRKKIVDKLPVNILYGKAIHPSAVVSEYASVDMGTVVMQEAIIQASAVVGNPALLIPLLLLIMIALWVILCIYRLIPLSVEMLQWVRAVGLLQVLSSFPV